MLMGGEGSAYNLKRRWKVAYQGYESVLNRKKRAEVRWENEASALDC